MIHGLYFSAQGAQLQSLRQDVLANNLANASTTGFKRELLRAQAFLPHDVDRGQAVRPEHLEPFPGGILPAETVTDFSQGSLQATRNPWDLAVTGTGFLKVTDGDQEFLTRDGRLAISQDGRLLTRDHDLEVLGVTGRPIGGLDPGIIPDVGPDGRVTQAGIEVGRIGLFAPPNSKSLEKLGNNLYRSTEPVAPAPPGSSLKQGMLEASGTRPMTEMLEMIESSRGFEANLNMIKYQDEALGRLLQTMPRK
jgi:flagellar basal-body rod protein FlgF